MSKLYRKSKPLFTNKTILFATLTFFNPLLFAECSSNEGLTIELSCFTAPSSFPYYAPNHCNFKWTDMGGNEVDHTEIPAGITRTVQPAACGTYVYGAPIDSSYYSDGYRKSGTPLQGNGAKNICTLGDPTNGTNPSMTCTVK